MTNGHLRDVFVWVLGLRGPNFGAVWQTGSLAVCSTFSFHILFVPKAQAPVPQPQLVSHGPHGWACGAGFLSSQIGALGPKPLQVLVYTCLQSSREQGLQVQCVFSDYSDHP